MKRFVCVLALGILVIMTAGAQTTKKLSASGVGAAGTTDAAMADRPASLQTPALSTAAIRLENDSDRLVFYAVIPLKGGELSSFLAQPGLAVDRLRSLHENLDYLAGGTVAPAIGVSEAEQLILGFEVEAGLNAYPVWYVSVPPKIKRAGGMFYQLSAAKPLVDDQKQRVVIHPVDFDLPSAPIRIDGRFVDWLKYSDILGFQDANPPIRVSRRTASGSDDISLDTALSFHRGGTDIEHLRAVRTAGDLMVMVSSHSVMSKGLSYLLRLYANDQEAANRYTLEIPVDGLGGPALLWTSGKAEPQILGNYATADYYVEARFSLKNLPAGLSRLFSGNWKIELSSSFTDSAMSEEFFWGRFPAADIMKAD